MAVPKKRTPSSKKGMRRSHHGRKSLGVFTCPNCKAPVMPHVACSACGSYRGRSVVAVAKQVEKAEKKRKAKVQQS